MYDPTGSTLHKNGIILCTSRKSLYPPYGRPRGGGGGVLGYISAGDVRRPFLGLKFSAWDFFGFEIFWWTFFALRQSA